MFEKDDTVASLSSVFKWSKAIFLRDGGIAAFVNKYKQVRYPYQQLLFQKLWVVLTVAAIKMNVMTSGSVS